jgi:hypothetical protein
VLNDDGDAVRLLAGLFEETLVLNLAKCFFGKFLVLAEAEDNVFQIGLPRRHRHILQKPGYSLNASTSAFSFFKPPTSLAQRLTFKIVATGSVFPVAVILATI